MQEYHHETTDLAESVGTVIRPSECTVFFCERGYAVVTVNFARRVVRRGDIVIIFLDTLFTVDAVSRTFRANRIEIAPYMLDEATFSLSSDFFDRIYDNPILPTTERQRGLWRSWYDMNDYCMREIEPKAARTMIRNQLQNLFLAMEAAVMSEVAIKSAKTVSSAHHLFNRFCRLLVENCCSQHDVKFYADKLCITPYYLSKITFKIMGIPPKELIDRQIVVEMKRLLLSTDLSAKEIAERFHFDSTSYMGRYFRRHTGLTPTEFREQ